MCDKDFYISEQEKELLDKLRGKYKKKQEIKE